MLVTQCWVWDIGFSCATGEERRGELTACLQQVNETDFTLTIISTLDDQNLIKPYEVTLLSVLHLDLMKNNFLKGTYATDTHSESRMQNCLLGLNAKLSCNNRQHPKTADRLSSCNEPRVGPISAQQTVRLNGEALTHVMHIPFVP